MTWASRICFSLLLAAPALAGTVHGQVELVNSTEPAVRKQKDYSGVVVWLEPPRGGVPLAPPRKPAQMIQKGKRFEPHVLAIQVGTKVEFPNYDPIFHNAFSNFSGQPFDTGLYPPHTSKGEVFKREGIVRVFCNIHSSMSAIIVVLKTPYFAVTGRSGEFEIRDVPAGEYELRVFHERATEETLKGLARPIRVAADDPEADGVKPLLLRISESGYLEVPHKNKYGQDYPANPPSPGYVGAPK